ncbi:MAG: helix-turn-helix domain-containing protein, partial [Parafannyhessea sp.]|uniref:helix-turn-helix domain-containing protein n=1 Tax=Parafannyhessea sp. TaxID=2847324 RepID=UPI003F0E0792
MGSYKIAEARRAKGWSQQTLAEKMGTTQQQIARWETGQRDPKADVILKMSSLLGATVSYLLGVDSDTGYIQALPARSYAMPVLGRIAAGTPREALSQSDETKQ